jgi:hypothetical protein
LGLAFYGFYEVILAQGGLPRFFLKKRPLLPENAFFLKQGPLAYSLLRRF